MSKITFRADEELVEAIESFEASKSEVMREALRRYLESHPDADVHVDHEPDVNSSKTSENAGQSIDELIVQRIDRLLEHRIGGPASGRKHPQDVHVNITLDGGSVASGGSAADVERGADARKTESPDAGAVVDTDRTTCDQCGENVASDHVYCPNCGEKSTHRLFCECGDEVRSDWAFCPSCGRRTAAADVLQRE